MGDVRGGGCPLDGETREGSALPPSGAVGIGSAIATEGFPGLARAFGVKAGGVAARAHARESGRQRKVTCRVGVFVKPGVGGEAVGGACAFERGVEEVASPVRPPSRPDAVGVRHEAAIRR